MARVQALHAACAPASWYETQIMGQGVDHRAGKEEAVGIKASEVGEWLRKSAGKRDHSEAQRGNYVVLQPEGKFHLLTSVSAQL